MRFVDPHTQTLSVEYDGATYERTLYKLPTAVSGADNDGISDWDASATYNADDECVVPELKSVYRCAADGTSGLFPPSDPTVWTWMRYTNDALMCAADELIGSQTVGTDMTMTIDTSFADTVALINCEFESFCWKHYDNATGDLLAEGCVEGRDIGCVDFAGYFYDEIRFRDRIVDPGAIDPYPDSRVEIIFYGHAKIGTLVVGLVEDLGCTLYGTRLSFEDRSRVKIDEYSGWRSVIRYGHIRVLDARIANFLDDVDVVALKVKRIIGKNVLWIPDESDRFSQMTDIAYIERFPLPFDNRDISVSEATLVGVVA